MCARNLQAGAYGIKFAARDRSNDSGLEVEEVSQYVASMAMMKKKELEQEREGQVRKLRQDLKEKMLPDITKGKCELLLDVTKGKCKLLPDITKGKCKLLPDIIKGK